MASRRACLLTEGEGGDFRPAWEGGFFFYATTELGGELAEVGEEASGSTDIASVDVATGQFKQSTPGDGCGLVRNPCRAAHWDFWLM